MPAAGGGRLLAVRSSPLLLRWGEFAAFRTLYDSLSKDNLAGRPACRTDLGGLGRQVGEFSLAVLAHKR